MGVADHIISLVMQVDEVLYMSHVFVQVHGVVPSAPWLLGEHHPSRKLFEACTIEHQGFSGDVVFRDSKGFLATGLGLKKQRKKQRKVKRKEKKSQERKIR